METSTLTISKPDERRTPFHDPDYEGLKISLMPPNRAEPEEEFEIYVCESTLEEIREYSETEMSLEVGGIMLGGHYVDHEAREGKGVEFIVIDGYVPAIGGKSQHASFTFTHEAWSHIHSVKDDKYPDHKIVGWHHTHPTFGIFLSSMDMFIQRNYFDLPWQVALVVDPVKPTLGFMRIREGETDFIRCPYFQIHDKKA